MSKHSAENSVAERRLRPIYDWLDNGNNKKALQEADKVLKKQPDFQCCRVLKCLALIRLGKEGEAEVILNKVLSESPVDEGALQAMTIAWRELQQPGKICQMYEGAVKKEPQNEEFLTHLFMSYVRLGEYKKQQLAAMNLYKVAIKNPYYFWSVMSLVLQAVEGDPALAKTVHLPLAHKMVQKMETSGKLEQEQEVLLYILILELKEDWKSGLAVLDGPLGIKLAKSASYRNFCLAKRVEFHLASEDWEEVAKLSREELDRLPDQWSAYTQFISAVKELKDKEVTSTYTAEEAEEFILSQQTSHPAMRGPWLAQLELVSTLQSTALLPPLILDYFSKFSTKPVTFSDLAKYLAMLDTKQQQELVTQLTNQYCDQPINNIGDICRDVNLVQLSRFCGNMTNLSNSHLEVEVTRLLAKYNSVQHIVTDMVSTDLRPPDNYLVLASHLLWDMWNTTKEEKYFMQCTALLYTGLSTSPSNWQMKLMLIKLMNVVGAGAVSYSLHSSLDIKHLMLDTLGWLLGRQLSFSGQLGLASQHASQTVKLYNHVNKDTADHIITAFRSGTFYQIRDIYKLRNRLATSHHFLTMDTERQLLDLLLETSIHTQAVQMVSYLELADEDKDSKDWDKRKDNRDMNTMASWDPSALGLTKEMVDTSFQTELLYSRTRQLLLKTIASAVYLSEDMVPIKETNSSTTNGEVPSSTSLATNLSNLTSSLQSHWSTCCQVSTATTPPARHAQPKAPSTPSLSSYSQSGQVATMLDMLGVASRIHQVQVDTQTKELMGECSKHLVLGLEALASKIDTSSSKLLERGEILEQVVWLLESVGLSAILCGVVLSLIRGGGGAKGGKKGKKGKGAVQQQFSELVNSYTSMLGDLQEVASKLLELTEKLEANISAESLVTNMSGLAVDADEILANEAGEVVKKMEKSYTESFYQVNN
eukprot:TRINITY_DN4142_c0_g1_i1.p1 TRINITY_DN4142_c0_g1~~TRINITY_DN4142_c0_g1_i1.p1  ORF type:complete len:932 (-),score=392.23 TRINITY_DN4142_c0_g1_i1:208-3003(-)